MKHRGLVAYLVIVSILSGGYIAIMLAAGQNAAYLAQAYMIMPAIAAIITRAFFDPLRFRDANLRFGRWRDYLIFWLAGIGITLLSYACYTLLGAGTWDFSGQVFVDRLTQQFAMQGQDLTSMTPAGMTPQMMVWLFFFAGLTVLNILPGMIMGLGEELGWRGLMFPRLYAIRPWVAFIVGGLIWFGWHVLLSLVLSPAGANPNWLANMLVLGAGSLFTFAYLAYVYVKTRSVFVTALAHITMNNAASAISYFFVLQNQFLANLGLTLAMLVVVAVLYFSGGFNQFRIYFEK